MPLTIIDFIEQVDGVTVEDIPPETRERLNDALADVSGGEGGDGAGPVNDDAILVSKNLDGRAGFTSIRDAIEGNSAQNGASGADEGDTIFVEAGDYDESVTVDTQGLTITGTTDPSDGTATVTGQSATTIEVRASDVTIDRLNVQNPGTSVDSSPDDFAGVIGVSVQSKNTGVTVRDCVIEGLGADNDDANPIGVYAQGATSGITVENNTIEGLLGTDEDEGAVQAVLINSQKAQTGISEGIDDARVANNTIRGLLDTRSASAIRFNGDVSGEIVDNTISDVETVGDIPGTNDPGGFTQLIDLAEGGNSTTGPSDVTVTNNDTSNIEVLPDVSPLGDDPPTVPSTDEGFLPARENFAPPVHLRLGSSTDGASVTVENNSFSADSPDVEVFVSDESGGLGLGSVANGNAFSPSAQVNDDDAILPGDLTLVSGGGDALQTAIDGASPGDRLAVDDSTYNPVTVDTPVSLRAIFGRPTIDASGSNPGIAIEAVDTLVSGFEITGDNSTVAGISIRTSEGATNGITLANNVISGITGAGGGGDVEVSFGILSFGDQELTNLLVQGNVIEDIGRTSASGVSGQSEVPGFGMQLEEIGPGPGGAGEENVPSTIVRDNIVRNTRGTATDSGGNTIRNYGIGIQPLDDNSVSDDFPADAAVVSNAIENAAVGIVRGDTDNPSSSFTDSNTFTNVGTDISELVTVRITNQGTESVEITEIDFEGQRTVTPESEVAPGETFDTTTPVPASVTQVTINAESTDGGAQGTDDVSTSFTSISVTRDIPEDRVLEISILGGS